MYRMYWIVLLVFALGCQNDPTSAQKETSATPALAEFALAPQEKPTGIQTEINQGKQNMEEDDIQADFTEDEMFLLPMWGDETEQTESEIESKSLSKKMAYLLKQLRKKQDELHSASAYEISPSWSEKQRIQLMEDILTFVNTRKPVWKELESAWKVQPKTIEALGMKTFAPDALWNKRLVVSCANQIYQAVKENPGYQIIEETLEEDSSKTTVKEFEPSSFLKKIEDMALQNEVWKNAQKENWDRWVASAPVEEQHLVFEEIFKELSQENLTDEVEKSWQTEPCVGRLFVSVETASFLTSLLSALPEPWRKTKDSVALCEETSGEECVRGYRSVSSEREKIFFGNDSFTIHTKITTVSCEKGFLPSGDCRVGYSRHIKGDYEQFVACDHYFNNKCYGTFQNFVTDRDVFCLPQPSSKLQIRKSDFDGSWEYYESKVGCGEQDYHVLCKDFDPKTFICKTGAYQEFPSGCMLDKLEFSGGLIPDVQFRDTFMSPECDILSCEIKNGVCVNEKVTKGRNHGINRPDFWAAFDGKKAPEKKAPAEFRLQLPADYVFE